MDIDVTELAEQNRDAAYEEFKQGNHPKCAELLHKAWRLDPQNWPNQYRHLTDHVTAWDGGGMTAQGFEGIDFPHKDRCWCNRCLKDKS